MFIQSQINSFNLDEPHNVDIGKKRQAWTADYDRMLVKAWNTIFTDSIVGNGAKWKGILAKEL